MQKNHLLSLLSTGATLMLLGAGCSTTKTSENPANTNTATPPAASTNTNTAPTAVSTESKKGVTAATVALHNTEKDCWLIVHDNVYNVTSYIPRHPGGPKAIISNCGKDGTALFEMRPTGTSHSDRARSMLATLLVGPLQK
jgi:cytochrome b involved in lipid metabolism